MIGLVQTLWHRQPGKQEREKTRKNRKNFIRLMCCMSHQRQAQSVTSKCENPKQNSRCSCPGYGCIYVDIASMSHSCTRTQAEQETCVCVRLSFSYNFTRVVVTATCLLLALSLRVCVCVASHASSSFHSTCQTRSAMQNGHQGYHRVASQSERLPCSRLAISDNHFQLFPQFFLLPESLKWCIVVCYFCIICNRMKN